MEPSRAATLPLAAAPGARLQSPPQGFAETMPVLGSLPSQSSLPPGSLTGFSWDIFLINHLHMSP